MNYVISIVSPGALQTLTDIASRLELPNSTVMIAHGTATSSMLDLLGIQSTERRILFSIASQEKTKKFISEQKRLLYIGVPGHGIVVSVPIKSIGGGNTLAYLENDQKSARHSPEFNFKYELIVAIANEGRTDMVINAARSAGATGGTVLHGKGTGDPESEKFLNVSIAKEKEVILIVSKATQKAEIMRAILRGAGPSTEAGAIVFSLPTSDVAGFGMFDEDSAE